MLALGNGVMMTLWERMRHHDNADPEVLWMALAIAAKFAERGCVNTCLTFAGEDGPAEVTRMRVRLALLLEACDKHCDETDASIESARKERIMLIRLAPNVPERD